MMKKLTRALALLLALMLTLSIIPGNAAAAGETVTGETQTYVLSRGGTDNEANFLYQSPYKSSYKYHGKDAGVVQPGLFTMIGTDGSMIPTYCIDIKTTAHAGRTYRRLNLEDTSYAGSAAGMIRAILLEGFYLPTGSFSNDTEHRALIAEKLSALGAHAGVEDLTLGEAISATQCAIWQVTHSSVLSYISFCHSRYLYYAENSSVTYDTLNREEISNLPSEYISGSYTSYRYLNATAPTIINNRIRTICNYLLSLAPVAADPNSKVVSPASFTAIHDPVFTDNGNGTCDVTISQITVNVALRSSDDWLKLTATVGDSDYSTSVDLVNGNNTRDLIIRGVPNSLVNEPVYLTISGYQTAEGFFMFDAEGDRNTSQTMVGYDSSRLPVFAQVLAQESRVLTIKKVSTDNIPLSDIVFEIYPVDPSEIVPEPQAPTIGLYAPQPDYVLVTNENGLATLNFTYMGLPDGTYLVVEREHPAIVAPVKPFYITLPTSTDEDGNEYTYEIPAYPKNEVKGNVKIEKDINSLGQNSAQYNPGEIHTWIISASIPDDFTSDNSYFISDTIDSRLEYQGNLNARLESKDGSTVLVSLNKDTDYILIESDDSFTLELTPAGKTAITAAIGTKSPADYALRIRFDTIIKETVAPGVEIPNQAKLTYINSVNYIFTASSDTPVVYTPDIQYGNANVLKVDADSGHPLSGAIFDLYKGSIDQNDPIESGLTSNADGLIVLENLEYDATYYLVETQAPAGYNRLTNPVAVTINANSPDPVVTIKNQKGSILPETGGMGTEPFLFSGGLLVAASLLLLLSKKRRASS